jgi:serine/threonine-protein kinase
MLVGQEIGPFAIEKELGSGAMGTVYLARHEKGVRVAIKVMAPGLSSKVASERFKRESDILKQLKHPNIVRLIASGRYRNSPFYAMEYIEGESLDQVMARRGRITWEEVVAIGQQLCAGLQHAHERGIVHRDLKPSNLMVLEDGTIKLTDFGIAKDLDVTQLTAANCTVGTAAYMSPEQCRGDPNITAKSDLYSMGIMFYELLTGKKPFLAESAMLMFELHVSGTFERPSRMVLDIPVWLDTLVCQLMEKSPDKRPFNAETVGQALGRVKEKVEAQLSAGIDLAKQRKIDRSGLQPKMDETDKEAARTLLKKKKKKKTVPFYRKGWFQAAGLSAILLAVGYVFYVTFIKLPSAESLIADAERLRVLDRRQARSGPIQTFMDHWDHYKDHKDAGKMRAWADEIDLVEHEEAMARRRNGKWAPDGKDEELYRKAMDWEDEGRIEEADKIWKQILDQNQKNVKDTEANSWHLLAKKQTTEIQKVLELDKELQSKAQKDPKPAAKNNKSDPTEEALALKAMRDPNNSKAWEELQRKAGESGQRRWYLLAAMHLHQLKDKTK